MTLEVSFDTIGTSRDYGMEQLAYCQQEYRTPNYAQGEVLRAANCPKATLTNTIKRHGKDFDYVEPDRDRGRVRRLFSMRDAMILGIVNALDALGVGPTEAVKHGVQVADWLGSEPHIYYVLTDFVGLWLEHDKERGISVPICYVIDASTGTGRMTDTPGPLPFPERAALVVNVTALAAEIATRLSEPYKLVEIRPETTDEELMAGSKLLNSLWYDENGNVKE